MENIRLSDKGIRQAYNHLSHIFTPTPLLELENVDIQGRKITVWGKMENIAPMDTFKSRGTEWCVSRLFADSHSTPKDIREITLVTASAGNHGQGLALAGNRYGFNTKIYVPIGTPDTKIGKMESLGAEIVQVGANFNEALQSATEFDAGNESSYFIHPFQNKLIMEGQGTIAREIAIQFSRNPGVEQFLDIPAYVGDLPDLVICPVGGGGLITGVGTYFNYLSGKMKNGVFVVGAQNEAADAMFNAYNDNGYGSTDMAKKTVADGICVKVASEVMSQLVRNVVDEMFVVSEESTIKGMSYLAQHPSLTSDKGARKRVWVRESNYGPNRKIVANGEEVPFYDTKRSPFNVEGAGAVPYALAVFGDNNNSFGGYVNERFPNKDHLNVVCVLSGGNIPRDKKQDLQTRYKRPM